MLGRTTKAKGMAIAPTMVHKSLNKGLNPMLTEAAKATKKKVIARALFFYLFVRLS